MTLQIAAMSLALKNVLVNPLMADGNPVLFLEPEAALFRVPVLAQQKWFRNCDSFPQGRTKQGRCIKYSYNPVVPPFSTPAMKIFGKTRIRMVSPRNAK